MRTVRLAIAWLVPALLALPAQAQIYRWTDDAGQPHFVQRLEDVPPAHRAEAEARWRDGGRRITITETPTAPPRANSPSAAPAPLHETLDGAANTRPLSNANGPGNRPESWWRGRHRALSTAVLMAERKVENIRSSSAAPASFDYSRRARRSRDRARWERNKALRDGQRAKARRLAEAEARLIATRQTLEEFRETARRADVPPGWIRD